MTAEDEGATVKPDPGIEKAIEPGVRAAVAQKAMPVGITIATPIRRVTGKGRVAAWESCRGCVSCRYAGR